MQTSPPAGPARQLTMGADAHAVLRVDYTLSEPATTELVLCDLLGRVWATVQPAACQPAGTYSYAHDGARYDLPADVYLLAFYCNGVCLRMRRFAIEP